MFLVRNVFHTKPGKAKELVNLFKGSFSMLDDFGIKNRKVMTDASGTFWTVVIQEEVEDMNTYYDMLSSAGQKPELGEAMKGYMELVTGGFREIYRIES